MDCVLPMLAGLLTSIIGFSIVMLIGKFLGEAIKRNEFGNTQGQAHKRPGC